MKLLQTIFLIILIFTLGSCTVKKASDNNSSNSYSTLIKNSWVLMDNNETLQNYGGQDITLSFDMDQHSLGGFSGCNQYFSNQFLLDKEGKFTINIINSTKRYCPDSNIEKTYLDLLNNVTKYSVDNGQLNLYRDEILLLTYMLKLE